MLLLCSRSRSSLFCSSRSRRRPARPCVRDVLRRCPVIKSGAAMLLVAQGTAGGLSPQPLVLSPHRGRRLKGRSSRLGVRYGPQPAKAADASVRSPGAETAAQRLIAAGCRVPLTLRRNWTVIELAFAKEDHRISDTERAGLQCHRGCLRQRRATSCWWKSGPKGGRRHNSPLSLFPPFARYHVIATSTCARRGNGKSQQYRKGNKDILSSPKT
jgi:hypothetical protein